MAVHSLNKIHMKKYITIEGTEVHTVICIQKIKLNECFQLSILNNSTEKYEKNTYLVAKQCLMNSAQRNMLNF